MPGSLYNHTYYSTYFDKKKCLIFMTMCALQLQAERNVWLLCILEVIILDRELFARNIINVIDVKNCTQYELFMGDDIIDQLEQYLKRLVPDSKSEIDVFLKEQGKVLEKVKNNQNLNIDERNHFFLQLINFKKRFILKR